VYAQHVEEVGGHAGALDLLGIVAGERAGDGPDPGDPRQRIVAAFDLAEDGAGDRRAGVTGCSETRPDEREFARVAVRQRPQQNAVENAEHGGIDADSQGERDQSD